MKHFKRILSFLTIICCLAGSWIPAQATSDDSIPRVTFINEPNDEPNLSVKKVVVNGTPEVMAKDEFTFTLYLNGKPAEEQKYRLYGADGNEVFQKDLIGNVKPYTTSVNGEFTLKAGEEAVFEWIGRDVNYEVVETPQEHYQQQKPEGGLPALGTMDKNGANVVFENKYIKGDDTAETTDLVISKIVPFLTDPFAYTPPETPDFTFRVTLDEKAYGEEIYTVTDSKNEDVPRTSKTEADGTFTLKGGETATFKGIPVGVDYKVEEINVPGGWRTLSNTTLTGTTKNPTILEFKNAEASFAVSKRMQDGSVPEDDFTFYLTNEQNQLWSDAKYYLYTTDGEPADPDEDGNPQIHKTINGKFTLKAGETAIFIGIPVGTDYQVREEDSPAYKQVTPVSKDGYEETVYETVKYLPFVNDYADLENVLTVTKKLDYTSGEVPTDIDQEFTFKLEKLERSTETESSYKPVASQVYYVIAGDYQSNYSTDQDGIFHLKANETARFMLPRLEKGQEIYYQVTEITDGMSIDYQLGNTSVSSGKTEEDKGSSEESEEGENSSNESEQASVSSSGTMQNPISGKWSEDGLNFIFTNRYTPDKVKLKLHKISRQDQALEGAVFILYRVEEVKTEDGTQNPDESSTDTPQEPIYREVEIGTYEVGRDGISIEGLTTGHYRLREIVAPVGYMLLENPVEIVIERTTNYTGEQGAGFELKVTIDGEEVPIEQPKDEHGDVKLGNYLTMHHGTEPDELYVYIYNDVIYSLPSTGGSGTQLYTLIGIALMLSAAVGTYLKKRRAI